MMTTTRRRRRRGATRRCSFSTLPASQGAQRRGFAIIDADPETLRRRARRRVETHVTWLARVKPTTLLRDHGGARGLRERAALRIVKAQEPHDVAMLFDGRHAGTAWPTSWSTDASVGTPFQRYVAFHYEVWRSSWMTAGRRRFI